MQVVFAKANYICFGNGGNYYCVGFPNGATEAQKAEAWAHAQAFAVVMGIEAKLTEQPCC